MTTITTQLAEALRAIVAEPSHTAGHPQRIARASEALAAYDAQQREDSWLASIPLGATYTLAEIRNGTGFPRGARFVMVK